MTERSGPSRAMTISLLVCVVAIAFEAMAVYAIMPVVAADLGGIDYYAWAFTLFVIAMLFATIAAGRLCDRVGPIPPLAIGIVLFLVGLVIGGFAPTMPILLLGRLVQGLGAGAMNLSTMVLLARAYAPQARASIMAWMSACWVMPAFFAPALGAWIASQFGWHWVFRAVVPGVLIAGLIAAGPMLRLRKELLPTGETDARPVPVWAAAGIACGTAGLQLAGQHLDGWSLVWLGAGVALLAVSLPRLIPVQDGPGHALWTVAAVRLLAAGVFFAAEAFAPLMLAKTRGLSTLVAGLALTVGSLGWTVGSWLQARPWITSRRDRLLQAGSGALLLGVALMALGARFEAIPLAVIAVAWAICGVGMGLVVPVTSLATIQMSSDAVQGRNNSSLMVAESLGNSFFSGLAGTIFAAVHLVASAAVTFGSVYGALVVAGVALVVVAGRLMPLTSDIVRSGAK